MKSLVKIAVATLILTQPLIAHAARKTAVPESVWEVGTTVEYFCAAISAQTTIPCQACVDNMCNGIYPPAGTPTGWPGTTPSPFPQPIQPSVPDPRAAQCVSIASAACQTE